MNNMFRKVSARVSQWAGSPFVFIGAIVIIIIWALAGPAAGYSNTWQLIINTGTTIITFLMVFLIQNTQNRDSHEIHLKLDELIRSNKSARNAFANLDDISDEELLEITNEFRKLHKDKASNKSMQKLHQRLELEHAKRLNIQQVGAQVVGAILDPLGQNHKR
jgi:low affinity Fe/Cu permease